jgi:hypothetical protein
MKDSDDMAGIGTDGRTIFQQTLNAESEGVDWVHVAPGDCGGLRIKGNKPTSSIKDSEWL